MGLCCCQGMLHSWGQDQASGAGQEHRPQLLQPLRVLRRVLVVNTHTLCSRQGVQRPDTVRQGA